MILQKAEPKSNLEKQMAGVIDPGYSGYGP